MRSNLKIVFELVFHNKPLNVKTLQRLVARMEETGEGWFRSQEFWNAFATVHSEASQSFLRSAISGRWDWFFQQDSASRIPLIFNAGGYLTSDGFTVSSRMCCQTTVASGQSSRSCFARSRVMATSGFC